MLMWSTAFDGIDGIHITRTRPRDCPDCSYCSRRCVVVTREGWLSSTRSAIAILCSKGLERTDRTSMLSNRDLTRESYTCDVRDIMRGAQQSNAQAYKGSSFCSFDNGYAVLVVDFRPLTGDERVYVETSCFV